MSDSEKKELDAFISFFSTFTLDKPVVSVADLTDGAALFQILAQIDADYFRQPSRPSSSPSDNWVLRSTALKRLYRLMTQYFNEILQRPTTGLELPDLSAVAKDSDIHATLIMCRMTIVIGVHSANKEMFIGKIQDLGQADQHCLMKAIEQMMSKLSVSESGTENGESGMTDDDHYYRIQSERSQIFSEKEILEKVYQSLLEEHRALQTNFDDVVSEKEDAMARMRELEKNIDGRRSDRADMHIRGENDRLRLELQKSEENLSAAETELDKHTALITELTRKVDELQVKADAAEKLKDQVDEYRHAADKLQKTENVMEKYKKKLQESAELRQNVKSLEKQNADLVDKNASLEEEYRKVAAFKPLMESYKNQINDLENNKVARTQELETVKFELSQAQVKLRIADEEKKKDGETLELYQERVRELELMSHKPVTSKKHAKEGNDATTEEPNTPGPSASESDAGFDDGDIHGLQGELDDAISGTTMTDLKLQVRRLKRELESIRKNEVDASRVLVLENLLEDANRMKSRYEADYLSAHREKLVLQRDLEEIRSGKSMGDGAEAAIALRQRLNETVDALDELQKKHAELEVKFDSQSKALTIAKSDLTLVNKDQLDILASLRESVNEDKVALEAHVEHLTKKAKELSDKNRMQLEQVNALLLEKVNLQSEGIGQREQMLLRERAFGDLRASMAGKDLPEDIKARMLLLHEENISLKESYKTSQEKLLKAKTFIKNQDKLFKEEHAKYGTSPGTFEEAEASFQTQIKILEEELERQKRLMTDCTKRYRREQELMIGLVHNISMKNVRAHLAAPQSQGHNSWLAQQRQSSGLKR